MADEQTIENNEEIVEQVSPQKTSLEAYEWDLPGDVFVRALRAEHDGKPMFDFWIQREAFQFCPFSVELEADDPEFEQYAWLAYQKGIIIIEGMLMTLDAHAKEWQDLVDRMNHQHGGGCGCGCGCEGDCGDDCDCEGSCC